jgi:uncharacterized protein YndB with AHSA1/START domain
MGLSRRISVGAPIERVYEAIATIEGLRGWWTPITGGSAAVGGELRFEFRGLDECIIMRVDRSDRPRSVHWTCTLHTEIPEWVGTRIEFELRNTGPQACELQFRHVGLIPELQCYPDCELGWDHFLGSLAALAETGRGSPF